MNIFGRRIHFQWSSYRHRKLYNHSLFSVQCSLCNLTTDPGSHSNIILYISIFTHLAVDFGWIYANSASCSSPTYLPNTLFMISFTTRGNIPDTNITKPSTYATTFPCRANYPVRWGFYCFAFEVAVQCCPRLSR